MTPSEGSSWRRAPLAVVLPLVAVGLLGDRYVHRPAVAAIEQAASRLESLRAGNTASKTIVDSGERADAERLLAESWRSLAWIERLLPSAEDLPDLLNLVGTEAVAAGVEIALLQPFDVVEEHLHVRHRYLVSAVGTYHRIGTFISAIASLPRIATPSDLTLVVREEAGETSDSVLEASFALETYVLFLDDSDEGAEGR